MKAKAATLAVILTGVDLALLTIGLLFMVLVRQKAASRAELSLVQKQRNAAIAELDEARRKLVNAQSGSETKLVSQSLLGLRGSLESVVIVVDKSGSMKNGRKWEYTREVLATWFTYLPIRRCAVILFDDSVKAFPDNGAFLELVGPASTQNRAALVGRLRRVKPSGNTNTYAALRRAYEYHPTAVILATDGFPDSGTNHFDKKMANSVIALCRHHHFIPVHVLALGNYFDPQLAGFLLSISNTTGGAFLGR